MQGLNSKNKLSNLLNWYISEYIKKFGNRYKPYDENARNKSGFSVIEVLELLTLVSQISKLDNKERAVLP